MATITGNWVGSTSNLSTLQNLNVEQTVLNAASLYNSLETEFWSGAFSYGSLSGSFISGNTFSGNSLPHRRSGYARNSTTRNTAIAIVGVGALR